MTRHTVLAVLALVVLNNAFLIAVVALLLGGERL